MKKYIHVTNEDRSFLAKLFGVSSVTVWKALRYEGDTGTLRKIRKAAIERDGIIMSVSPLMETLHDADGYMRQYFPNGALLEVNKEDDTAQVIFNGKVTKRYEQVLPSGIWEMQKYAATLR